MLSTDQHCCWADRLSHAPVAQGEKEGLFVRLAAPDVARGFLSQKQGMRTQAKKRGSLTHLRALRQLMLPDFGSNGRANGAPI